MHRFQGREGKIKRGLKKQIDRTELNCFAWAEQCARQKMAHPCITIDLKKKKKSVHWIRCRARTTTVSHFKKSFSSKQCLCTLWIRGCGRNFLSLGNSFSTALSKSNYVLYLYLVSNICATIVSFFFFFLTSFWTSQPFEDECHQSWVKLN